MTAGSRSSGGGFALVVFCFFPPNQITPMPTGQIPLKYKTNKTKATTLRLRGIKVATLSPSVKASGLTLVVEIHKAIKKIFWKHRIFFLWQFLDTGTSHWVCLTLKCLNHQNKCFFLTFSAFTSVKPNKVYIEKYKIKNSNYDSKFSFSFKCFLELCINSCGRKSKQENSLNCLLSIYIRCVEHRNNPGGRSLPNGQNFLRHYSLLKSL